MFVNKGVIGSRSFPSLPFPFQFWLKVSFHFAYPLPPPPFESSERHFKMWWKEVPGVETNLEPRNHLNYIENMASLILGTPYTGLSPYTSISSIFNQQLRLED